MLNIQFYLVYDSKKMLKCYESLNLMISLMDIPVDKMNNREKMGPLHVDWKNKNVKSQFLCQKEKK